MIKFLLIFSSIYTINISGYVPEKCGAVIENNVAHHFCNKEGPYTITVYSPSKFVYGDKILDAGTHTLTFTGPEKVDRPVYRISD